MTVAILVEMHVHWGVVYLVIAPNVVLEVYPASQLVKGLGAAYMTYDWRRNDLYDL